MLKLTKSEQYDEFHYRFDKSSDWNEVHKEDMINDARDYERELYEEYN